MIDFIITTASRPEYFERTLASISENLIHDGYEFRYILHEDKLDEEGSKKVIEIAKDFGFSRIIVDEFSVKLGESMKTLIAVCESDLIVRWEDDWIMRGPVDFGRLIDLMKIHPIINQIQLCQSNNPVKVEGFNCRRYDFDDVSLTLCHEFGMAPCVLRGSFFKDKFSRFHPRGDEVNKTIKGSDGDGIKYRDEDWCYNHLGCYWLGEPNVPATIQHIGMNSSLGH